MISYKNWIFCVLIKFAPKCVKIQPSNKANNKVYTIGSPNKKLKKWWVIKRRKSPLWKQKALNSHLIHQNWLRGWTTIYSHCLQSLNARVQWKCQLQSKSKIIYFFVCLMSAVIHFLPYSMCSIWRNLGKSALISLEVGKCITFPALFPANFDVNNLSKHWKPTWSLHSTQIVCSWSEFRSIRRS